MAKIIVTFNGLIQKEISIVKSRFTIGRRPSNDLVLDHLTISGQHAAIDSTPGGAFVLDLGSTNGTLVNGQPITKHLLQNDDVIELGKYKLTFQVDFIEVGKDLPETSPASGQSKAETPTLAKIKVLNGSNAGRELILSKPVTTMGSPAVLVVSIARERQSYFLTRIGGNSFPKVNEVLVNAKTTPLKHGDVIDLSGTKMLFSLLDIL